MWQQVHHNALWNSQFTNNNDAHSRLHNLEKILNYGRTLFNAFIRMNVCVCDRDSMRQIVSLDCSLTILFSFSFFDIVAVCTLHTKIQCLSSRPKIKWTVKVYIFIISPFILTISKNYALNKFNWDSVANVKLNNGLHASRVDRMCNACNASDWSCGNDHSMVTHARSLALTRCELGSHLSQPKSINNFIWNGLLLSEHLLLSANWVRPNLWCVASNDARMNMLLVLPTRHRVVFYSLFFIFDAYFSHRFYARVPITVYKM